MYILVTFLMSLFQWYFILYSSSLNKLPFQNHKTRILFILNIYQIFFLIFCQGDQTSLGSGLLAISEFIMLMLVITSSNFFNLWNIQTLRFMSLSLAACFQLCCGDDLMKNRTAQFFTEMSLHTRGIHTVGQMIYKTCKKRQMQNYFQVSFCLNYFYWNIY